VINRSWVQVSARHSYAVILGKLFTPMCLVTKQYNLVLAYMPHDALAVYPWSHSVSWHLDESWISVAPVGTCGLGRTSTQPGLEAFYFIQQ